MKKNLRDYAGARGLQYAYFLDSINGEPYGRTFDSDAERVAFLFECFEAETAGDRRGLGVADLLAEWLRGIPSAIDLPFYDDDILSLGRSWGLCGVPRRASFFLENFFKVAAGRLLYMREYFQV